MCGWRIGGGSCRSSKDDKRCIIMCFQKEDVPKCPPQGWVLKVVIAITVLRNGASGTKSILGSYTTVLGICLMRPR
eukprot:scaffold2441_cov105-Cylindrotheca_fusiformis.AAC.6